MKLLQRFKRWLLQPFENFVLDTIQKHLTIGGNCGCCGAWVPDCILEQDRPYTLCTECINKK